MQKLRTSLTIIWHSLHVLRRNPRLLVFPVISLAAALVVYVFVLAPLLFHTSMVEIWQTLRSPDKSWDAIAPWRAAEAGTPGGLLRSWSLAGYAGYYLLSMFVVTFGNVALYSEIIEALNGNRVSISRGFALACARVRAIVAWSLLAGLVGILLRVVQERVGFFAKWVSALAGLSWSVASVFVIPVIINEPRYRKPVDYLKISSGLVKRVWGEGVIGLTGIALVVGLVLFLLLVTQFSFMFGVATTDETHQLQITLMACISLAIFSVLYLAWQIFECGLYVYATQGVAPGTFDEEMFDRAWTVRGGMAGDVTDWRNAGRPKPRSRIWPLFPIAIGGVSLCWHFYGPAPMRMPRTSNLVLIAVVDLADLGYQLNIKDLQVADIVGNKCSQCDFSATGSIHWSHMGTTGSGSRLTMGRHKEHLYLHFYDEDRTSGRESVSHSLNILRSRLVGHEYAIAEMHDRRIEWGAIPGAVSYRVELDCDESGPSGNWCKGQDPNQRVVRGLKETSFSPKWLGDGPGRWRVQAVDASGTRGPMSDWTDFPESSR